MDSATLTALGIDPEIEPEPEAIPEPESLMEISESQSQSVSDTNSSPSLPVFGPMAVDEHKEDMKRRVSSGIDELLVANDNMQKFLEFVKADRVIVEVEKIV